MTTALPTAPTSPPRTMGARIQPTRPHGTKQFQGWRWGERVRDGAQLRAGDTLVLESTQFNAINLARVTRRSGHAPASYLRFILRTAMDEDEFVLWDFQIDAGKGDRAASNVIHRALPPDGDIQARAAAQPAMAGRPAA